MAGPAVAAPDFQLTVSPKTVFLAPGGSVDLTIGGTGIDGFTSPLTLKAMNLPTGVTASFSVNPLVLPGTSTLTLTAGPALVAEEFNVNIAATGGGITHFALNDVSVLDFDLKPVVVEPPPCQGSYQGRLTNSETGAAIANARFSDRVLPRHDGRQRQLRTVRVHPRRLPIHRRRDPRILAEAAGCDPRLQPADDRQLRTAPLASGDDSRKGRRRESECNG